MVFWQDLLSREAFGRWIGSSLAFGLVDCLGRIFIRKPSGNLRIDFCFARFFLRLWDCEVRGRRQKEEKASGKFERRDCRWDFIFGGLGWQGAVDGVEEEGYG